MMDHFLFVSVQTFLCELSIATGIYMMYAFNSKQVKRPHEHQILQMPVFNNCPFVNNEK